MGCSRSQKPSSYEGAPMNILWRAGNPDTSQPDFDPNVSHQTSPSPCRRREDMHQPFQPSDWAIQKGADPGIQRKTWAISSDCFCKKKEETINQVEASLNHGGTPSHHPFNPAIERWDFPVSKHHPSSWGKPAWRAWNRHDFSSVISTVDKRTCGKPARFP